MGVLCAGTWVLSSVGFVDASFARRHVGFKRPGMY